VNNVLLNGARYIDILENICTARNTIAKEQNSYKMTSHNNHSSPTTFRDSQLLRYAFLSRTFTEEDTALWIYGIVNDEFRSTLHLILDGLSHARPLGRSMRESGRVVNERVK
jgi:hypothetical protein